MVWGERRSARLVQRRSKHEVILCRHPDTKGVCGEEDGGVWDEEKPSTSSKYPGEARVCAGCMMRAADSAEEGV